MAAKNLVKEFDNQNQPVISEYYYDKARIVYAYLQDHPQKIINLIKRYPNSLFFELIDPANLSKNKTEFESSYKDLIVSVYKFFEKDIRKEFKRYCSTVSNDKIYVCID